MTRSMPRNLRGLITKEAWLEIEDQKLASEEGKFPVVPRVSFNGDCHILCGNGAHFAWSDAEQAWTELLPIPGSVRDEQLEAARRNAEREKEREENDRLRRERIALERQEFERQLSLVTLPQFICGVLYNKARFETLENLTAKRLARGGWRGVRAETIAEAVCTASRGRFCGETVVGTVTQLAREGVLLAKDRVNNGKHYTIYDLPPEVR